LDHPNSRSSGRFLQRFSLFGDLAQSEAFPGVSDWIKLCGVNTRVGGAAIEKL